MLNHSMLQLYNLVVEEVYNKAEMSRENPKWTILDRPLSTEILNSDGKTVTLGDCFEASAKRYAELKNSAAPQGAKTDVERACGLENNIL